MALLSGSGSWFKPQDMEIGGKYSGVFVSYEQDVPGGNPAFPDQDVLTLDVDGAPVKIGANASVKQAMRANLGVIKPGDVLTLINRGPTKGKKGFTFNKIEIDHTPAAKAMEFPPAANEPMAAPQDDLERRLAEARARRAA